MGKYIDADKLIAEIERLDKENKELLKSGGSIGREFLFGIGAGYADIIKIITSLQQEQPEPSNLVDVDAVREDFIAEVYRVLDADSTNDRANAIIDAFDSFPTVSQIQPEVDLEKEMDSYFNEHFSPCVDGTLISERTGMEIDGNDYDDIARHFAEWGAIHLNARKEE